MAIGTNEFLFLIVIVGIIVGFIWLIKGGKSNSSGSVRYNDKRTTSHDPVYELQEAFSRKEKIDGLLANLEELKGGMEEEQQSKLKSEYNKTLLEASVEIQKIKERLSEQIVSLQKDLEMYQTESKDLDTRFKVGEVDAESYRKQGRKLAQEISKSEEEIAKYKTLLEVKTAAEVGGYIDVPLEKSKPIARAESSSNQLPDILKDLNSSDFTSFYNYSEIEFIGMKKIAIYGAGMMILSLFLPWASFLGFSSAIIWSGTGFWYLILGVAAVAAIFMKNSRASALVLTGAGGIALLINIPSLFGFERAFLAIGFYLYLIGSLAVTYVGVSRLKEMVKK